MAQTSTRTAGGDATPPDDSKTSSSGLSVPQIVAGALAAATAAILGSFMGVAGTIGGAAVASVISTVGSSLYQRSLERTRDAVKDRLVVNAAAGTKVAQAVAKVTGDGIPAANPQGAQRPGGPGARPGAGARPPGAPPPGGPPNRGAVPPLPTHRLPDGGLAPGRRQVGTPQPAPQAQPTQQAGAPQQLRAGGRTVTTRLDSAGRPVPAPADPTRRIPDARTPEGPPRGPDGRLLPPGTPPRGTGPADPTRRVGMPGVPTPPPGMPVPPPGGDPTTAYLGAAPDDDPTQLAGAVDRPRRKRSWKTWVTLGGVAASIFAIGLLASFAVESAAGHPLSGGSSGTSVGSLFGESTTQPQTSSDTPTTENSDGSEPSTTESSDRTGGQQTQQSGSNSSRTTTPSTSRQSGNTGGGGVLSSLVPQFQEQGSGQ
ncbi:hypothetical protein [Actinomycetospora sp. TBRC 11914]|uniref:hypothetical protein n=1 Tax=Actinomycetospora sp. TBRC 11914 TaxID=2729387 RepID=UPI00145D4735|nr:hypothetical protein [Actinomycetospora sp. TBRC 11914]NMO89046.1 hypothetical protein [Actinomycetospora sp. TBRC 11914]